MKVGEGGEPAELGAEGRHRGQPHAPGRSAIDIEGDPAAARRWQPGQLDRSAAVQVGPRSEDIAAAQVPSGDRGVGIGFTALHTGGAPIGLEQRAQPGQLGGRVLDGEDQRPTPQPGRAQRPAALRVPR